MGISQTTSAIMVFLAGLLPASCHKESPPKATATVTVSTNATEAKSFKRVLGEIALTNHNDTCVLFSTGESFTLTPKMLDKQNVQITLSVESKDDYGDTRDFAVTRIMAQPGKQMEVAIGTYNLSFIPQVFP
jgi:hypothetical protein